MTARTLLTAAAAVLLSTLASPARAQLAGRTVLYVNSYHEGYQWSDGVESGARAVLGPTGVKLVFHRMDMKRHQADKAFAAAAAKAVQARIEELNPGVVILADDPAVSEVLVPLYKTSKIPFVFCGLNWDAKRYGLGPNATGMIEVALVKELLAGLRDYAKGDRLGFLTADAETERIEGAWYTKLGLRFTSERYVKTFAEWKKAFLEMQGEVDVLFIGNYAGINDWNEKEAAAFVLANAKVPSGSIYDFMMPFVMLGYTKIAEEQGAFAGTAALQILKGSAPASIPVAANKKAKIFINPKLAAKAGIIFKPELVKVAEVAK